MSISKCLLPSIDGFTRKYQDGWWIFTDSSVSDTSLTQASCGPNTDVLALEKPSQPDSSATGMPSASGCGSSFSDDILNIPPVPIASSSPKSKMLPIELSKSKTLPMELNSQNSTVHQNPNWLYELKENFKDKIIASCSARTKEAVECNAYIEVKFDENFFHISLLDINCRILSNTSGSKMKLLIHCSRS